MAITQPTYPTTTADLVVHIGDYVDSVGGGGGGTGALTRLLDLAVPLLGISASYVSETYEGAIPWIYAMTITASVTGLTQSGTLSIEISSDGTTWTTDSTAATASGAATVTSGGGPYWRIRFVNGATAQSAGFTLSVTVNLEEPA